MMTSSSSSWGSDEHNNNMTMQYTVIFHGGKNDNFQTKNCDIFLIFAQNIHCGWRLEPIMSTHNLWCRAKLRKIIKTIVHPSFTIKTWGEQGLNNKEMLA